MPLSGPTNSCPNAATTSPRRRVPTPGSTTATWIVPSGHTATIACTASAPSITSWAATSWLMSMKRTAGFSPRMTAFISATYGSRIPKSVVSVMTAVTSTIAVDDEVRDQRERLALVGGRKRLQLLFGGLRVFGGPDPRVLHPVVGDHEPANFFQLAGFQCAVTEQRADFLSLGGGRALEHRDQREGSLTLSEVAADRFAETILVGAEVERVVGDLKGDAEGQPVTGQGFDHRRRDTTQERADPAARRDERSR